MRKGEGDKGTGSSQRRTKTGKKRKEKKRMGRERESDRETEGRTDRRTDGGCEKGGHGLTNNLENSHGHLLIEVQ